MLCFPRKAFGGKGQRLLGVNALLPQGVHGGKQQLTSRLRGVFRCSGIPGRLRRVQGILCLPGRLAAHAMAADELDTVPATLPALMRAQKLQKRADRCGAEQSAPETARQALRAALDGWNREQDAQAAGELLFAAANAMRLAGVDAEEALTFASKRYCAELLAQKEQSGTQVE